MNPNYETTEVGGNLAGTSEHGRIYHFNEVVTGNPRFGIGYERYEALPDGWMEGKTIVDAIGRSFTVEHIVHTAAGTFTGDNAADEKAHPMLTMQVQGICPYGWHVANASDWLDLAYAASQASAGHTFPVNESRVTYKQFTTVSGSTPQVDEPNSPRGIGNFAPWLRNSGWGSNAYVSDGADEFGFNYYPIGFRYMTQGFQCAGTRCQTFVPLCYNNTKYPGTAHIPYQCNHQQQGYFRRDDESRQRASDLPVPLREELRRGVIRRRSGRERAEHPLPDPSLLGKGGAATENDFKPKQNNETIPIFIDLRGCGDGRLYGGAARFRHDARGRRLRRRSSTPSRPTRWGASSWRIAAVRPRVGASRPTRWRG